MSDQKKFFTRMGDGSPVYMTEEEIRADIQAGIDDAVLRGKIDPLSEEDAEKIFEIVTMRGNIVGVEPGMEIVRFQRLRSDKISTKCGVSTSRDTNALIHERVLGADSVDIGYSDYNYKTVKGVAKREATVLKQALTKNTMPLFYGAMPNLGFYTKPDGPVDNWAGSAAGGQDQRSHGGPGGSRGPRGQRHRLRGRTDERRRRGRLHAGYLRRGRRRRSAGQP